MRSSRCPPIAVLALALLPLSAVAQGSGPPVNQNVTIAERLTAAALQHRLPLHHDGRQFSGPAWERLLQEARAAHVFGIGEEHGIAENPKLAGALFTALASAGYARLVIEVSPPMALALDRSARDGIDALRRQFAQPGGEPAFFGMREEAELLATVRATVPGDAPVLWGVDYEVGGDRLLLARLAELAPPAAAAPSFARLQEASRAAWAAYSDSGDISKAFSFSGDPELVAAVQEAWADPGAEAAAILDTLHGTLEINRLWVAGRAFDSNQRRAERLRSAYLTHWQAAQREPRPPRVMIKLGASHVTRGLNSNAAFDIGTLAPELAAATGGRAFTLMVLPGRGSPVAVLNPARWVYESAAPKDGYMRGLDPLLAAVQSDAMTLIDLRPLRPILGRWRQTVDPDLMSVVHGFDMLLVMSGSTASSNLRAP